MRTCTAVIEKCKDRGLLVGYWLGLIGARTQAENLDELHENLQELPQLIFSEGEPDFESEFIGPQSISVA